MSVSCTDYANAAKKAFEVYVATGKLIREKSVGLEPETRKKWQMVLDLLNDEKRGFDTLYAGLVDVLKNIADRLGFIIDNIEMDLPDSTEENNERCRQALQAMADKIVKLKSYFGDKAVFPQEIRGNANEIIDGYLTDIENRFGIKPNNQRSL